MVIFKVLHVLSMFAAATLLVGEALLYARAIWRGDVTGLATVRRLVGGARCWAPRSSVQGWSSACSPP